MSQQIQKPILYVKQAVKDKGLGDCPFCHKVLLLIAAKNLDVDVNFIDLSNKPDSFLKLGDNPKYPPPEDWKKFKTTPVLDDEKYETRIFDSGSIVDYLEQKYSPKILGEDKKVNGLSELSPSLINWVKAYPEIKNNNEKIKEFEKILESTLEKINDSINDKYEYINGNQLTKSDLEILPKLYHLNVILDYLYNWKLYDHQKKYNKLINYYDNIVKNKVWWKKYLYSEQVIINGYAKFYGSK